MVRDNMVEILVLDIGLQPPQRIYFWKVIKMVVQFGPYMISTEQMKLCWWRDMFEHLYNFVRAPKRTGSEGMQSY